MRAGLFICEFRNIPQKQINPRRDIVCSLQYFSLYITVKLGTSINLKIALQINSIDKNCHFAVD